jgi:hypothetical protein
MPLVEVSRKISAPLDFVRDLMPDVEAAPQLMDQVVSVAVREQGTDWRTIEIKSWTQAIRRLELWAPTGLAVAVGDQLRIYPGGHKRVLEDCRDRFRIPGSLRFDKGNARNFRGEPYVPGGALTAVQAGRG